MEDVLSVYQRPHDPGRPVVCLDEKSKEMHGTEMHGTEMHGTEMHGTEMHGTEMHGTEMHGTPLGALPASPGTPRREDYEYQRNGTANLFLWVEPLAGRRHITVTERRTAVDFAHQLRSLSDEHYPQAEAIVLVTDNLNTHTPACLYEAFAPEEARRLAERFEWHYTPEHGSWLNMAEIELSVLARQCLNRRLPDAATLAQETAAWEGTRNRAQTTIRWQFTAADARIKLWRLYPQIKDKT